MTIALEQVISAIEMAGDAYTFFLDLETGETVSLPDWHETGERDEELEELLDAEPDRFVAFPTQYDIHEYHIMAEFVEGLALGQAREDLAGAIRGRGAFRRFRETLRRYGLEKQWYAYRDEAIREIALNWCRGNGISLHMP